MGCAHLTNAAIELRQAQQEYMKVRDSGDAAVKEGAGQRVARAAQYVDDVLKDMGYEV